MVRFGLLVILWVIISTACSATVNKVWNILTIMGTEGKYLYQLQPQLRLADQPILFNELTYSLSGGYQSTKNLELWLGQSSFYFNGSSQHPSQKEYRFFQQVQYTVKETAVFLAFLRSSVEERQCQGVVGWNYRLRQRFGFNQKLNKNYTLVFYDELFVNLNKPLWIQTSTLAQNRFFVGLSQQINKKVAIGMGYMNQLIFSHPIERGNVLVLNLTFNISRDKYGIEPVEEPY